MKPNKDGYWLIKRRVSIMGGEISVKEIVLLEMEHNLVHPFGCQPKRIGTFEREYNVIEWIKYIDIEKL